MLRTTRCLPAARELRIILAAVACVEPAAPLPSNSQRFTAPPVYQLWWSMVQACSGHTGNLAAVEWYVVPGADSISDGSEGVAGYWSSSDNRIVLIGSGEFNGPLVRHEMLHALVRVDGHPRSEFVRRCGGVVDCRVACVEDAGPPATPATSTPRVPPDSLELGIEVQPAIPGVNTSDGYFTITVTARNPSNHPVVVLLRPSGDSSPNLSFTCGVAGPGSRLFFTEWAWDPEAVSFAAGETKRRVLDLVEGTAPGAANIGFGTFTVQGTFGGRLGVSQTLVLGP
jgi:hypothetical protein